MSQKDKSDVNNITAPQQQPLPYISPAMNYYPHCPQPWYSMPYMMPPHAFYPFNQQSFTQGAAPPIISNLLVPPTMSSTSTSNAASKSTETGNNILSYIKPLMSINSNLINDEESQRKDMNKETADDQCDDPQDDDQITDTAELQCNFVYSQYLTFIVSINCINY